VISPLRALLRGSLGFAAVSVAAFSVWAFGGTWFRGHGGDPAMYAAIAAVFLGLTGALLHPLVGGPRPLVRFTRVFVPAFLAYAGAWCAAWFPLGFGLGEWLGSLAGSAAFALVAGALLGNLRAFPRALTGLFAGHSAGYFAGGPLFYAVRPGHAMLGMLGWGLLYGLGFGAGIGYAFFVFQKRPPDGV
jgi:hypothetical protein